MRKTLNVNCFLLIRRCAMVVAVLLSFAFASVASAQNARPNDQPRAAFEVVGPNVKVSGSVLEFDVAADRPNEIVRFEIFSITGQLVKAVNVGSTPVKVELPKGFYIIKCENWTRRVMLK